MNIIKNGFKNCYGKEFPNIRDVHFEEKKDLMGNLGTYKAETKHTANPFFSSSFDRENGVYIYQTHYDPNIALRIYKDFANYKYLHHNDELLVSELQNRQKDVKLTEFPTGIVSIENKVIGQEIPFYEDHETIKDIVLDEQKKDMVNPITLQLEMLKILKELVQNGIIYYDIHAKNFMLNTTKNDMKLIDFDINFIAFDDKTTVYNSMISNLKNTINTIDSIYGLNDKETLKVASSLEEVEELVQKKGYNRSRG